MSPSNDWPTATRSPLSGPSSRTPTQATTAATKSLRRTRESRARELGRLDQVPDGVDDDRRQHGAGQRLEGGRRDEQDDQDDDGRGHVAHLGAGTGARVGGRLGQAAPDAHASEEAGSDVGDAVGDQLGVVAQLLLGVLEGARGRETLGDADPGDGDVPVTSEPMALTPIQCTVGSGTPPGT